MAGGLKMLLVDTNAFLEEVILEQEKGVLASKDRFELLGETLPTCCLA